jgi:hypothetical protein
MGAVAWDLRPGPRFPSPLIEPDVRNYRIRLSDWLHRKAHSKARRSRPSIPSTPRSSTGAQCPALRPTFGCVPGAAVSRRSDVLCKSWTYVILGCSEQRGRSFASSAAMAGQLPDIS